MWSSAQIQQRTVEEIADVLVEVKQLLLLRCGSLSSDLEVLMGSGG